jgi:hypothetical protein
MNSLPLIDPVAGPLALAAGNSLTCRVKHHFLIPLDRTHCFHIGRGDNYPLGTTSRPCTSDEYPLLPLMTSGGDPPDLTVTPTIQTCMDNANETPPPEIPDVCGIQCQLGQCGTE